MYSSDTSRKWIFLSFICIYFFLKVGPYLFEKIILYKYLGVNISNKNNVNDEEIQKITVCANKCYSSLLKLFKSKLLPREQTKITLCIRYLRPIIAYGCETRATTKGDHFKINTIERKVLRKIFGHVYNNTETRSL